VPEKITIDKSGANTAAIERVKADACVDILMRQNKYEGTPHFPVTASSAKIGLWKSI
jgi:transposase-like protein